MNQMMFKFSANLLSPKDAAVLLKVHPQTFRRWAAAAKVRPLVNRPNCRRYSLRQVLRIGSGKGVAS